MQVGGGDGALAGAGRGGDLAWREWNMGYCVGAMSAQYAAMSYEEGAERDGILKPDVGGESMSLVGSASLSIRAE